MERILSPDFKTTSAPVVIDFLIRHGRITPETGMLIHWKRSHHHLFLRNNFSLFRTEFPAARGTSSRSPSIVVYAASHGRKREIVLIYSQKVICYYFICLFFISYFCWFIYSNSQFLYAWLCIYPSLNYTLFIYTVKSRVSKKTSIRLFFFAPRIAIGIFMY